METHLRGYLYPRGCRPRYPQHIFRSLRTIRNDHATVSTACPWLLALVLRLEKPNFWSCLIHHTFILFFTAEHSLQYSRHLHGLRVTLHWSYLFSRRHVPSSFSQFSRSPGRPWIGFVFSSAAGVLSRSCSLHFSPSQACNCLLGVLSFPTMHHWSRPGQNVDTPEVTS